MVNMLTGNNCIILVTGDNGGHHSGHILESGYFHFRPLRGTKETLYEGGIREAAFILSPFLSTPGFRYKGKVYFSKPIDFAFSRPYAPV